jgi:hypothetical protein
VLAATREALEAIGSVRERDLFDRMLSVLPTRGLADSADAHRDAIAAIAESRIASDALASLQREHRSRPGWTAPAPGAIAYMMAHERELALPPIERAAGPIEPRPNAIGRDA